MCSRICNWPSPPVTTGHYTSKWDRAHSKHSYVVTPLLTILWIMWLLPTSNSIPNLFVFSGFYPKWQIGGSNFLLQLQRWAHCSSHRAPERENACWLFGFELGGGSDSSVWCQGLLCVPLFVWVCQSACRVLCSRVYWLTNPPYESVIQTHGPDLSFWISLLFPWWSKGAWRWWLWLSHFFYLFPNGCTYCC